MFLDLSCIVLSHVGLFATPWTVALQAPLSMEFPRQAYWSGLPSPSPGDLLDLEIEPVPSELASRFFTTEPPGKSKMDYLIMVMKDRKPPTYNPVSQMTHIRHLTQSILNCQLSLSL